MLPAVIGLGLVLGFGLGMEGLLRATDRDWFPVVSLDLEAGVDRSYAGQYARDSRFLRLLERLPDMRGQALTTAQRRTGLTSSDPDGFVVRFKDTADYGAASRPVRAAERDLFLVTLSAEQAVLGVMDVRATLAHELIHCLMRERMGDPAYRALPHWIREGVAVWGAGQLRERSRNLVADAFLAQRDPSEVLRQAETLWFSIDRYLLDALTFEWIAQVQGEMAVRELLDSLVGGQEVQLAIEDITGLPWGDVLVERRRFARRYFEDVVLGSGLVEFRKANALYKGGDRSGAITTLHGLVFERPDSLLTPNAWYWLGRWNEEQGSFGRASTAYSVVLERFPQHLGLQEESRLGLAACLQESGRFDSALAEADKFLVVHPRAPTCQRARAQLIRGQALSALGELDSAAAVLRGASRCRDSAADALVQLCLVHLEQGAALQGRQVFSELSFRFPRSKRLVDLRRRVESAAKKHLRPIRSGP